MPRTKPEFKSGDRVLCPVLLMGAKKSAWCKGTVDGVRWEPDRDNWAYGVELDAGGGTLAIAPNIRPLDVVDRLADLA